MYFLSHTRQFLWIGHPARINTCRAWSSPSPVKTSSRRRRAKTEYPSINAPHQTTRSPSWSMFFWTRPAWGSLTHKGNNAEVSQNLIVHFPVHPPELLTPGLVYRQDEEASICLLEFSRFPDRSAHFWPTRAYGRIDQWLHAREGQFLQSVSHALSRLFLHRLLLSPIAHFMWPSIARQVSSSFSTSFQMTVLVNVIWLD